MLRGLRAAGYDVTEVHREVWAGVEDKSQAGGLLNTFKYPLLLAWGSLITGLRYLVRRPRGPIVVAYFGHLDLLPAKLLALLLRRPLVFDLFLSMYDTLVLDRRLFAPGSLPARLIRTLEGWLLRLPDAVVCDTGANCDFLRQTYDLPSARLWSVPVGCEQEFFHPPVHPPPAAKDPQAPLELLFYGQYIPLHGIDHILDAAAELREDPGVQFTLVGRGQEYPRIKARAQRLGLGNVSLIEWLPYEELRERIYRADIGLGIFGISDKAQRVIPNKVFQIMACGTTPIVTGRTSGIGELLEDGRDAILCDCGSGEAIAAAVERLRDPTERARIAANALGRFERAAGYDVIGRRFAQVLRAAGERLSRG
jgi:glycosyltransferase involved in cell wall biosynthesis